MNHDDSTSPGHEAAPNRPETSDMGSAVIRTTLDASPVAAVHVLCSTLSGAGQETSMPSDTCATEDLWTVQVLHANDIAWRLFGATSAETLARHLQHELARVEVEITLLACIRTGTLRHAFGVDLCTLAGSPLRLDLTANRVGGSDGLPARLVVFMEDRSDLEASLRNQEAYRSQLAHLVEQRSKERTLLHSMAGSRSRLILNLLQARSPYVVSHMQRVALLADGIGRRLGLSDSERADIACAAALHDVGVLNVPGEILGRSGPLSAPEFALVQQHPLHSCDILAAGGYPEAVLRIIAAHHERCDGSGYPLGASGDDICLGARILAVADVVDAMTAQRPHRPPLDVESVLTALGAGSNQFDPRIVEACRDVLESDPDLEAGLPDHGEAHFYALNAFSSDYRFAGLPS